ncbi:MAG TPA: carboxymuconolactone decarboxylase family protein [Chitinophaga sp.]|uniref:carboxymuconolactone decarboxylase family protein n=1 Tax=Chitinophaga sp. TaxID=1869181 RepID=UPI002DC0228E|nr:carboxymuconolactone decarboxylase family protein [Chitinophaga sp.]HEU4555140.1 carboxymuconolactone decarboxylase family protein [Chitinophaga sp.]
METRMQWKTVDPEAYKAMSALETYVRNSDLDKKLMELVKIRASQINGCAFCLDMHAFDARKHGETEQRLYTLAGWRDAPFFTDRERAALALTEAMTLVSATHVPDDVYNEAARHFSEKELLQLIMLIVTINGWNRIVITTRTLPQPR